MRGLAWTVLALNVGCGSPRSPERPALTAQRPVIDSIAPASGPAGPDYPIHVVIYGRGFAASGNTVTFGPIRVAPLPSSNGGTRIEFSVPKEAPSPGEVPPMPLLPGAYEVTVSTPHGTSRPVRFHLTQPRSGL